MHRVEHGGKSSRVRRDHEVVAQTALQSQAGHAERFVLIGAVAIDDVVRAFRDAPRHAMLFAVPDLSLHGHPARLVEQGFGVAAHDEERHQVLEHRRAPREECRHAVHARHRAAKPEPVRFRHVAFRDRDEAGEPRFRGKQIVVRVVETAGAFCVRGPVADRQQAPFLVVEQPEVHAVGEDRRPMSQVVEAFRRDRGRLQHAVDVSPQLPRPVRDVRVTLVVLPCIEFRDDGLERRQRSPESRELLAACSRRASGCPDAPHRLQQRSPLRTLDSLFAFGPRDGAMEQRRHFVQAREIRCLVRLEGQLAKSDGERQERSGEVAAVHGRHIARRQRREALRVVPVEEVALEARHPFNRRERCFDALYELGRADEAEIVSGERREQSHADIGGRRPVRHDDVGRFLTIVWRQEVIFGADEGVEVAPRLAGDEPEQLIVGAFEFRPPPRHRPAQSRRN